MAITQITAASLADNAVTAAKIGADQIGSSELNLGANYAFTGTVTGAGGGASYVDTWVITSNVTTTNTSWASTAITTNLARHARAATDSTVLNSQLGSAMTQSSGIFTFPATGHWLISFFAPIIAASAAATAYGATQIWASNDSGSNFTRMVTGEASVEPSGAEYHTAPAQCMLDVTNVSTFRVKFTFHSSAQVLISGTNATTEAIRCYMRFVKLADT